MIRTIAEWSRVHDYPADKRLADLVKQLVELRYHDFERVVAAAAGEVWTRELDASDFKGAELLSFIGTCIHSVAGVECPVGSCDEVPPHIDHPTYLKLPSGEVILVAHLYADSQELDDTDLDEMREFSMQHRLCFTVSPRSPYFPGRTVMVIWRRESEAGSKL